MVTWLLLILDSCELLEQCMTKAVSFRDNTGFLRSREDALQNGVAAGEDRDQGD